MEKKNKGLIITLLCVAGVLAACFLFVGFSVSWSGENLNRIMKTGSVRCLFSHEWADATCTERHCIHCGREEGELLAHEWAEATCTEARHCSVCGLTDGDPLGHKWVEATCTEPQYCSVCKATEGDPAGHKWIEATCTEPKHCSVCSLTEGSAAGHNWAEATCTEPKHCTVCGITEGSASGHNWKKATCTEPKTCTVCGATEGKANGHRYAAATCTSAKRCKDCLKIEGKPLGHNFVDYVCTRCGKVSITASQVPQVLKLTNYRFRINSVGGIETYMTFKNGSATKTIKYINITVQYKNSVGDVIANEINGEKSITYQYVGPLGPGQTSKEYYWLHFYNSSFSRWSIPEVEIIYMDGSKLTLDESLAAYICENVEIIYP